MQRGDRSQRELHRRAAAAPDAEPRPAAARTDHSPVGRRLGALAQMTRRGRSIEPRPHAPVQRIFDDLRFPARKMGVEVTEANAGPNRIEEADPVGTLAAMAAPARALLWQHANLPDHTGAGHNWSVATVAGIGAHFGFNRDKHAWMRWGDVSMTEDHGEFEWIVHHPAAPQRMSHYRAALNTMNQSRQAMRAALSPIGADLVVARNDNPAAGEAFHLQLGATNAASAQVTFESTSAAITKRALLEGVSHGLNKRNIPTQDVLANATPDVTAAVTASAGRMALPGVNLELVVAYIYGDLIHKMAVMQPAAAWAGGNAGNAKNWRNLFPKSRPYQITLQAYGHAPSAMERQQLQAVLDAAKAAIVGDILALFSAKLAGPARVIWHPNYFNAPADPTGDVFTASNAGVAPAVGGVGALTPQLAQFFVDNGLDLGGEYDNVRDAFLDFAAANVPQVVRSSDAGFAQHAPGTSGFATEDRGEVATAFPGLDTTYDRIKTLAGRF